MHHEPYHRRTRGIRPLQNASNGRPSDSIATLMHAVLASHHGARFHLNMCLRINTVAGRFGRLQLWQSDELKDLAWSAWSETGMSTTSEPTNSVDHFPRHQSSVKGLVGSLPHRPILVIRFGLPSLCPTTLSSGSTIQTCGASRGFETSHARVKQLNR